MKSQLLRIGLMSLLMVAITGIAFAANVDNDTIASSMTSVWGTAANMVGGPWGKLGGLVIALGGVAAREKIGNINMAIAIAIGALLPMAPDIMDAAFTMTI
jgi:hypothetical protein